MAERADIREASKAEVLMRLYNHAVGWNALGPLGGALSARLPKMTIEQARELVYESLYFDYVGGRKLGVDLAQAEVDFYVYDRDSNGPGSARKALEGVEGVRFL